MTSAANSFDASFTTFSELTNDERTRTFLVLEAGAGHREVIEYCPQYTWLFLTICLLQLRRCLDLLAPTLGLFRQKEFYVDPKFHTSIAWALLEKTSPPLDTTSHTVAAELDDIALPEREKLSDDFHRIPHFPNTLVPSLNEVYGMKLSQARTGGFVADRIAAKIGKDVFTWPLIGMR